MDLKKSWLVVRSRQKAFAFRSASQSYFDSDSVRFKRFFPNKYIRNCVSLSHSTVCARVYLCPLAHFACPVLILSITRRCRYVPLNCDYYPFRLSVCLSGTLQIITTQWHGSKAYSRVPWLLVQGYTPTAVSQSIPNRRTPSTAFSSSCRYVCATNKIIFCLLCPWLDLAILICTTSEWCSSDPTLRPAMDDFSNVLVNVLSHNCWVTNEECMLKKVQRGRVSSENPPGSK